MAKRMSTANRMDRARDNAAISRSVNGALKRKEKANRMKRMKILINSGSYPFTPAIMSWVSTQLGKPATQCSAEECKTLAK
jgi:hypothetical protein